MRKEALKFLFCPSCKDPLQLAASGREGDEEIWEGVLSCASCALSFPIYRGIPRILVQAKSPAARKTQKHFAFSWKKFRGIYSDPRDFLDWIYPKGKDFFQDKVVLDAGCGSGRHAVFASEFGAREVVAFDLSDSVEVAFALTQPFKNVHIIQADIYNLPFRDNFDFIYSIGVLQHLPEPERGFRNLVQLLKRGGWISIWVYGYEGTGLVRRWVDPVRRNLTTRIPLSFVFSLSFFLTILFYGLSKGVYRPLLRKKWSKFLFEALPMSSYMAFMSQFDFLHMFNSVFDQLIAPITRYFRRHEVEAWLEKAKLGNILITDRNRMSWRGTGQRLL